MATPKNDKRLILAALKNQVEAANTNDVDKYGKSLHPDVELLGTGYVQKGKDQFLELLAGHYKVVHFKVTPDEDEPEIEISGDLAFMRFNANVRMAPKEQAIEEATPTYKMFLDVYKRTSDPGCPFGWAIYKHAFAEQTAAEKA